MRVAALDLGSNTFLCLIAEVSSEGGGRVLRVLNDEVEMVRLGEGLSKENGHGRSFSSEALLRAEHALQRFSKTINRFRPERVLAVATAAARKVDNPSALLELGQRFGIPIQIISGEEEARITFQGGLSGFEKPPGNSLMIDIGGGSTEIISGRERAILGKVSLPFGAVSLTERSGQDSKRSPQIEATRRMEAWIAEGLQALFANPGFVQGNKKNSDVDEAVGIAVAGTAAEFGRLENYRTGGVLEYSAEAIDKVVLTPETIAYWKEELGERTPGDLVEIYKVHPRRADVLFAGLLILEGALKQLALKEWRVSTRGIRYGVAIEIASGGG